MYLVTDSVGITLVVTVGVLAVDEVLRVRRVRAGADLAGLRFKSDGLPYYTEKGLTKLPTP